MIGMHAPTRMVGDEQERIVLRTRAGKAIVMSVERLLDPARDGTSRRVIGKDLRQ